MNKRNETVWRRISGLGSGAMMAVLLMGTLLLTLIGALSYRRILKSRDSSAELRGSLSYLSTQVKSHDRAGCVELREDGRLLVLSEPAGDEIYELRIYLKDGSLVEEYAPAGTEKGVAEPVRICPESDFSGILLTDSMLRLTTGHGTILIHLRSGGKQT